MSQHNSENSNSSFIFGLVIGAIIGAVIAIVIYRQNKGKIFDDLQEKLEKFFKNLLKQDVSVTTKPKKNKIVAVSIPKVETPISPPPITFVRKPAPKTFIKPKK